MAKAARGHLADARGAQRVSTPLLVVEDDPQVRSLLALLLEDEGYPVVAASDGLDALRYLREHRPSLVMLDLGLPYVNGDEVATRIRACYGGTVPIILVIATRQGGGSPTRWKRRTCRSRSTWIRCWRRCGAAWQRPESADGATEHEAGRTPWRQHMRVSA